MRKVGIKQIDLTTQQQDFVAAVSHELKTPLTAIHMYGEMLQQGWVSESNRMEYYVYILSESERLTRLISNVLQLARMTRNELAVHKQSVIVADLLSQMREKTASYVAAGGYELAMDLPEEMAARKVLVDVDFVTQIIINLMDNAVKFAANHEPKRIDLGVVSQRSGAIEFYVRDYGPGVAADQMNKIFRLFYRSENELTRETVGTEIGLALVRQLAQVMGTKITVRDVSPGARFSLEIQPVA